MTTAPLLAVTRLIVPVTFVVGFAVLIKGYADTGDGFAAGVIVSLGVILLYTAAGKDYAEQTVNFRHAPRLAMAGLLLALIVAFVPVLFGDPILTHQPRPGADYVSFGTIELLTAVAFDVGVFLLVVGTLTTMVRLVAHGGSDDE